MPNISLKNVSKRYGELTTIDNITLEIPDNYFLTLLGPSGCGKTTILRMIAGLISPTSGTIKIGDEVVFDSEKKINVPVNKRKIGFIFQNYALWPNMTVYQNISFGLKNKIVEDANGNKRKMTKEEIDEAVESVAKLVHIENFYERFPSELSGGQQQRCAIARTLAPKPRVIFMDEPLSNLDAKLRLEMRYEMQRLHIETKTTFVYVTHDQTEAMTLSDKICLLNNGVLQQFDEPLTIYNKPSNMFVADFVGNPSINFIDCKFLNRDKDNIEFEIFGDKKVKFIIHETFDENEKHEELILGIRPEYIKINDNGKFLAKVFASMPTGMETTLKLHIDKYLINAVAYGSCNFILDKDERFDIHSNNILLFDKKTKKLIAIGEID